MTTVVVFDVETNGKALNFRAPVTNLGNWPRVTQMAWKITDGEWGLEKSYIIKPDGWVVPKEKFFIDNNISTERCEADGVPIQGVLEEFANDLLWADNLVAHNMAFDYNVVGAEMLRYNVRAQRKPQKICTMNASTHYCKIVVNHGYKWPKLEELHRHLFHSEFDGAHDAMFDVRATEKCYFELKKRGVI